MGKKLAAIGLLVIGLVSAAATSASAAPAAVTFNLQDGNTAVGFRYDRPVGRTAMGTTARRC